MSPCPILERETGGRERGRERGRETDRDITSYMLSDGETNLISCGLDLSVKTFLVFIPKWRIPHQQNVQDHSWQVHAWREGGKEGGEKREGGREGEDTRREGKGRRR